jgi:DNA-binding GntR family transcriptional regulator
MAAKWERLYTEIRQEIEAGERPLGSKLPSLASLYAERRLSQTTVMRAYRALVDDGLAIATQGSGTYVTEHLPTPSSSTQDHIAALENRIAALEAQMASLHPDFH